MNPVWWLAGPFFREAARWRVEYSVTPFVLVPAAEVLSSCSTRTLAQFSSLLSSLLSLGGSPGGKDSLPSIFTAGSGDESSCVSVLQRSGAVAVPEDNFVSPALLFTLLSSQLICCDNHGEPWWRNTPSYPQRYILCHKFISGSLVVFLATESLLVSSVARRRTSGPGLPAF